MSTMTSQPATVKPRSKKERRLSYNPLVGCLHLSTGGKERGYWLDRLDHDLGTSVRCFRLTKIAASAGEPDHYDVVIGPDGDRCECLGYLRWNHCKHTAALRCLLQRGSLS